MKGSIEQSILDVIKLMPRISIADKGNNWVNLASLGKELIANGIDYHSLGYDKLKELVDSYSHLLEQYKDESKNLPVYYVRENLSSPSKSRSTKLQSNTPRNALTNWAFLGYYPTMINSLKELALEEKWEFASNSGKQETLPILSNYLKYTFYKLQQEKDKILVSDDGTYAVFNTGLVDKRYMPIYALFKQNTNQDKPQKWYLVEFCIEGENRAGKTLVDQFKRMPAAAHYFNEVSDMLYDTKMDRPSLDIEHIILERINRFPYEFIQVNAPRNFEVLHPENLTIEERTAYFDKLRSAIKNDMTTYRSMSSRLEDALSLALKRVQWNYKSAIPMFYPRDGKMCLLLPLCLVKDNSVDAALVISKTKSGRYQGETIYSLDWAYKCARLVCRPDSDWLTADNITDNEEDGDEID